MIRICFNDELVAIRTNSSLHELLIEKGYTDNCFAVALNQQFIQRSQYAVTQLQENDNVAVIRPMQGG